MPVLPAPLTVPQQSNTQKAAAGVVNMHHSLPNGGMLNLNLSISGINGDCVVETVADIFIGGTGITGIAALGIAGIGALGFFFFAMSACRRFSFETMKILNALQLAQTVNMGSNTNQQTQELDPLAAMITESIAFQFMPVPPAPFTVPQQSSCWSFPLDCSLNMC
jgi:hypothetical protein